MTAYVQATLLRAGGETSVGISLFCLKGAKNAKQSSLRANSFEATVQGMLD